jgi:hypothetical protein
MYNRAITLFHSRRIHVRRPDKMIDLVMPQMERTGMKTTTSCAGRMMEDLCSRSIFRSPKPADKIPQRSSSPGLLAHMKA